MPTNKPEVVLPEAPPIPAHLFDKDQSIVWAAAWETLRKHMADTLNRPADGDFVVVPREPTKAMLVAGDQALGDIDTRWEEPDMGEVYAAMLSAAPQQGGQEVVGTPYRCDYCGADYGARACCDMRYEYLRKFGENILPPISAQQPAEAVDIEGALDAGDPNWRVHRRPNLKGGEQLWFAIRDIAELRSFLAGERSPLPGSGLTVVRTGQATPPPAIDIGKLRELVSEWRSEARDIRDRGMACNYNSIFARADQLAALIGDGGERQS